VDLHAAGQGRADESSMVEAIKLAVMMAEANKGDKTRSSLYDKQNKP